MHKTGTEITQGYDAKTNEFVAICTILENTKSTA